VAAYHALLLPLRGPKMIWQGGELGYEVSINTNGRLGNKPFKWEYLSNANRVATLNEVALMAKLKQHVSFGSNNYEYNVSGVIKTLKVSHDSMNTVIVGNFDIKAGIAKPVFQHTGWWYNYVYGDSIEVLDVNAEIALNAGAYKVYTDKKINASPLVPVGISEEFESESIVVYPNPASNFVRIYSGSSPIDEVEIIDASGKVLKSFGLNQSKNEVEIDSSELPKGVYLLKLRLGEKMLLKKILLTE
jgi:hypothetical protein